jgi:hypothetical protein
MSLKKLISLQMLIRKEMAGAQRDSSYKDLASVPQKDPPE